VAIVVFMPEGLVPGMVRLARWIAASWHPAGAGSRLSPDPREPGRK